MGGALDSARFRYFLSTALGVPAKEVEGMVIGGHGDKTHDSFNEIGFL